jgi:hypothetical protein
MCYEIDPTQRAPLKERCRLGGKSKRDEQARKERKKKGKKENKQKKKEKKGRPKTNRAPPRNRLKPPFVVCVCVHPNQTANEKK